MQLEIVICWFVGVGFSIVSSLIIFITYFKFKAFRQHPNNLVVLRTSLDFVFCLLLFQILANPTTDSCNLAGSKALAFVAQVSVFGSELCFLVIGVDLALSVVNPFTDFKANSVKYRQFIFVVSCATGLLLICIPHASGLSTLGICWTAITTSSDSSRTFNPYSWGFFFIPIVVIYGCCLLTLLLALKHLQHGLPASFESHQTVIKMSLRFVVGYAVYWTIAATVYCYLYWNNINFVTATDKIGLLCFLAFVLGGKVIVTAVVWILNAIHLDFKNLNSDAEGKIISDLNTNLRAEVLEYTTEGIRASIALADSSQEIRNRTVLRRVSKGRYYDSSRRVCIAFNEHNDVVITGQRLTNDHATTPVSEHPMEPPQAVLSSSSSSSSNHNNNHNHHNNDNSDTQSLLSNAATSINHTTTDSLDVTPKRPSRTSLTKAWIDPNLEGNIIFYDFRSNDFKEMREMCGISASSYDMSLRRSAKERFSEGASGAFLYFSHDQRFIVKTTTKSECEKLCSIMDSYKRYFKMNPGSLITKFFGCHMIKMYTTKVYFLVMENVFITKLPIHERYDLKGSWVARNASAVAAGQTKDCRHCLRKFTVGDSKRCSRRPNQSCVPNVVLKDNNLNFRVHLPQENAEAIMTQLKRDADFLASLGIMDYSLLMGVHRQQQGIILSGSCLKTDDGQPVHRRNDGGIAASVVEGPGVYFFGIIDILQQWDISKKMERWAKILFRFKNKKGISAVEPRYYSERFKQRVVDQLFHAREDDSVVVSMSSTNNNSVASVSRAASLAQHLLDDQDNV